jgi:hypothetical protein
MFLNNFFNSSLTIIDLLGNSNLKCCKNMPQIDNFSFASQLIWFVCIFVNIYCFNIWTILPKLSAVIKIRASMLSALPKISKTFVLPIHEKLLLENSTTSQHNTNTVNQEKSITYKDTFEFDFRKAVPML